MARMLGRKVWYGVPCSCCNGSRGVKVERTREKRELARELHPEGLLPTAEADDGDCQHGCNGGCVYGGSERCNFTCHDLEPEAERLFERMDRRAMELMGEEPAAWRVG
jgi:hypothetical protein